MFPQSSWRRADSLTLVNRRSTPPFLSVNSAASIVYARPNMGQRSGTNAQVSFGAFGCHRHSHSAQRLYFCAQTRAASPCTGSFHGACWVHPRQRLNTNKQSRSKLQSHNDALLPFNCSSAGPLRKPIVSDGCLSDANPALVIRPRLRKAEGACRESPAAITGYW